MALAHNGVHAEHSTGEVTKFQDIVALCGINRNIAILEGIAIQELDDHTCIAVHLRAGTDTTEKDERLLQFQESVGISKLTATFRLVRNDGPAQWVVVINNRIHAESHKIDLITTESESSIRIQLKR
jgi:hypothetical protein